MTQTVDIQYFDLFLGLLLLGVPLLLFRWLGLPLTKPLLGAVLRMCLQLSLVGLYLEYLFSLNNLWVNLLWVFLMLLVSAYTVSSKSTVKWNSVLVPCFLSSLVALVVVDAFLLGYLLRLSNPFEARYFIPISGMILGNMIVYNTIGLSTYVEQLYKEQTYYQFLKINGNSARAAFLPFIRNAVLKGFNPLISSTAVIGLVALPGMMTGQILGGSSPAVAIKYQILIILAICIATSLSLVCCMWLCNKWLFDENHVLKTKLFEKRPNT